MKAEEIQPRLNKSVGYSVAAWSILMMANVLLDAVTAVSYERQHIENWIPGSHSYVLILALEPGAIYF